MFFGDFFMVDLIALERFDRCNRCNYKDLWMAFMGTGAVIRIIEQCCFNSVPDLFNGEKVNFILKPPKVVELRTCVKKVNLKH